MSHNFTSQARTHSQEAIHSRISSNTGWVDLDFYFELDFLDQETFVHNLLPVFITEHVKTRFIQIFKTLPEDF